jgi:LacI family transcriptional regulator
VAEATRDRVRTAIDELGFIRNETARRLRQGVPRNDEPPHDDAPERIRGTDALGLVLEELTNPYFADVARGAESAIHSDGGNVIWATTDGLPGKETRCLDFMAGQGVCGVLITPVALGTEKIACLREHGMSVVLVDHELPGVCSARVDHTAGGDIAVTRLLEHGPRRIAFVTGNPGLPGAGPVRDRMIGAARALERAELEKPAVLAEPSMTATGGQRAARRLLALDPQPSGVFCGNDLMAVGLVNELLRVGVKIPEEIAVVGYDDIELAATSAVPLTTVRQPRHELGERAARLLLAEVADFSGPPTEDGHKHTQIVLTPELVIRETG